MIRSTLVVVGAMALFLGAVAGCQKPNMDELMRAPARPTELDQLNDWVGTWEGNFEMIVQGEDKVRTMKGISTFRWGTNRWVLTEHSEGSAGDNRFVGDGMYTWNASAKRFEFYSVNDHGEIETGTGRYDAGKQMWYMTASATDTVRGGTHNSEGTLRMPDKNTMEFDFAAWGPLHLSKVVEMKGTAKRK